MYIVLRDPRIDTMLRLVLWGTCFCAFSNGNWMIPDATVEIYPKGFRVSIPDVAGIKLVSFHFKINEEFKGRELGTFYKDIMKPKKGRWTYVNTTAVLEVGDTLHYGLGVRHNENEYIKVLRKFTVTNKTGFPEIGSTITTSTTTTTSSTTTAENPDFIPDVSFCGEYSSTVFNGRSACRTQLIFKSTFSSNSYEFWSPEIIFPGMPDYEFVVYTNITVKVNDGKLSIRPIPIEDVLGKGSVYRQLDLGEQSTGNSGSVECAVKPGAGFILPPVTSAQLTTRSSFMFKYGKVEVRAKLPRGDWIYPELYLTPASREYGPGYQSGQIRIAFTAGNIGQDRVLQGGVVLGDSMTVRNSILKEVHWLKSWSDDFHNFSVVWEPDRIALYVDGSSYGTIRPPQGGFSTLGPSLGMSTFKWSHSPMAPFDKEMYLTIGVGVGGYNFADGAFPNKPWRNGDRLSFKKFYNASGDWLQTWGEHSALQIDEVKVWAI